MKEKEVNQLSIKEKLKDYNDLIVEISDLKSKIKKLEGKAVLIDTVQSSSKHFPYVKRNIVIENPQPKLVETQKKLKNFLEKRVCKLIEKQIEIENFIAELPTSRLRNIFEMKYIKQYTWRKIAYILGGNATEDSVRMEHNLYFKNN